MITGKYENLYYVVYDKYFDFIDTSICADDIVQNEEVRMHILEARNVLAEHCVKINKGMCPEFQTLVNYSEKIVYVLGYLFGESVNVVKGCYDLTVEECLENRWKS